MAGVTLSRGSWDTLRIVHTERDTADRVDVSSAVAGGRGVARAIVEVFG